MSLDQSYLQKLVTFLDKRLKDETLEFEAVSVLPREEKVGLNDLLQNTEIRKQIEENPAGLGCTSQKRKQKSPTKPTSKMELSW